MRTEEKREGVRTEEREGDRRLMEAARLRHTWLQRIDEAEAQHSRHPGTTRVYLAKLGKGKLMWCRKTPKRFTLVPQAATTPRFVTIGKQEAEALRNSDLRGLLEAQGGKLKRHLAQWYR